MADNFMCNNRYERRDEERNVKESCNNHNIDHNNNTATNINSNNNNCTSYSCMNSTNYNYNNTVNFR